MRINTCIIGFNGDFGALAGITGGFFDFQQAVFDFRHFLFKQFHQKFARGAAEDNLFAAAVALFVHAQEEGADAVAAAEVFARDALVAWNQRVQTAYFHDDAVAFHTFYRAHYHVFAAGEEFLQNLLALGIADAL